MKGMIEELAGPPPDDFPSRCSLALGEAGERTVRPWWFWVGLVCLCAIPRILLAWLMPAYCNDAYFYVYIADQITEGNLAPLLSSLGINIYPLILIAGHWLGFTWTGAGVVWGIAVGSLTILPLYGWLRRIGNDRLALAGCLLYISQPKFIELSMEPIRDSSFWFFFVLCLYSAWRAMEAMKFRWCLSAGIALVLAIHTRTEGWFLLVPLAWWLMARFWEEPADRWRTATGSLGLFAMIPLFLVAFNLTVLRAEPEWRFGKLKHFATGWEWFCAHVQPVLGVGDVPVPTESAPPTPAANPQPAPAQANPIPAAPAPPIHVAEALPDEHPAAPLPAGPESRPFGINVKSFFQQLHSAIEPLHYFLILVGFVGWRHLLWRRRFLPLVLLAAMVCLAVWVFLSRFGTSNGRYFLTAYLALLPLESLALLKMVSWFHEKQAVWAKWTVGRWHWGMNTVMVVILVGWIDAFIYRESTRKDEVALAGWLKSSPVATSHVAVDPGAKRIGYHLHDQMPTVIGSPFELPNLDAQNSPEVVIVSKCCIPPEQRPAYRELAARLKYHLLDIPADFPKSGHLWILVKDPAPAAANHLAAKPRDPDAPVRN